MSETLIPTLELRARRVDRALRHQRSDDDQIYDDHQIYDDEQIYEESDYIFCCHVHSHSSNPHVFKHALQRFV